MLLEKLPLPEKIVSILKKEGIESLNPPQVAAIKKGLFDGKNLVVASPTASGKTLIAEMAILKNFLEGKKSIYLVPLKALASEKYSDFSKYKKIGMRVAMAVGWAPTT
jgi:helicase